MFCNQCGTQVPDHATVCVYCGASLSPIQGAGKESAVSAQGNMMPQTPTQSAQNLDSVQTTPPQMENTGAAQIPPQQMANAGAVQIPPQQMANAGAAQIPPQQMPNTGYAQTGMQQPNQQMYYGVPMQGYSMPRQSTMAGFGKVLKNAPGEFAGRVKRMGVGIFCLLGIIAAMLFLVAPFMNFVSIHVNERVEVPSYYQYNIFSDDYGSTYHSELKVKAGVGLDLFELAQLSGTVNRLSDKLGGGMDTGEIADTLERAEDYLIRELEDELDTSIKESSVKEVFGTARLILKGHAAALITPWILIICGIGLLIFTVTGHKALKLVFSLVPLGCLIWLITCSGHFFAIMGIGAWAIILGILLGVVSALKDA